jgi:MYXO-CTERM domain-containing protein
MVLPRLVLTLALLAPAAATAQTPLTSDAIQPSARDGGGHLVAATKTSTPAPASPALVAGGLVALAGAIVRRRRSRE